MLSETLVSKIRSTDRPVLARMLRECEEPVLTELRSTDILTLQTAYRYAAQWLVWHLDLPKFDMLPERLRCRPPIAPPEKFLFSRPSVRRRRPGREPLRGAQYAMMLERIERAMLLQLFTIQPTDKVLFPDNPEQERARRVVLYSRQFEKHRRHLLQDESLSQGPAPKRVYCRELRRWFNSARQAASFLRRMGQNIQPSDIRTAVKRGCRRGGFTWSRAAQFPKEPTVNTIDAKLRCPYGYFYTCSGKQDFSLLPLSAESAVEEVQASMKRVKELWPDAVLVNLNLMPIGCVAEPVESVVEVNPVQKIEQPATKQELFASAA